MDWKKEVARDLMALGSIPLAILVVARAATVENFQVVFNIIVAIALLYLISFRLKNIEHHSAIIIILAIFTTLFYASYFYAVFVIVVVITALYAIKVQLKKAHVYRSVLLGLACSAVSYLAEIPLQIPNI